MTDAGHDWLRIGSNVGGVMLPMAEDGRPRALFSSEGPTVIVVLPAGDRSAGGEYLTAQSGAERSLAEWGARLVVVIEGSRQEAGTLVPASFARQHAVLADPRQTLGANGPAAMVVDQWGEVFFARRVERVDQLPTPAELMEWVVFVAIQCPECEGPEGPWRTL